VTFLRALKDIPELNLDDGDILEPILTKTVLGKKAGPESLTYKILRQPDREIRLPLDYVMPFESFEEFDPRLYSLRYVSDNIAFPVAVRFIGDVRSSPETRIALKGELRFEEIVEESIVIATTKLRDQFAILKLPVDLPITVFPIRKLHCNAEYIRKYWERLQPEIDRLETQITSVEDDLLPTSFLHEAKGVSIVDECVSALESDGHVYEAMPRGLRSSFSDRQYQCLQKLEETEDFYEVMELPNTKNICEYMPISGKDEDEYVVMETKPLLDGCEHVYEAMKPLNAQRFSEARVPYSRAESRQRTDSKITQSYRESLYSSVASSQQDSASTEKLQRISACKLKQQDQTERIKNELTGLYI